MSKVHELMMKEGVLKDKIFHYPNVTNLQESRSKGLTINFLRLNYLSIHITGV